jgi:hypothetical protein
MTTTRSGLFPRRFLAFLTTTAVLLSSAVVAVEIAAAAQHVAPAKHCKAKCRKAKATHYLEGHRYSYVTGYAPGSGTSLKLDFCADGTLHAGGEIALYRLGVYGFSYEGTWSVISAARWSTKVAFTTTNWQTNYPGYLPPSPAPAGVVGLWIKARNSTGIRDGGGLFDPVAGQLSRAVLPSGSCPVIGAPAGA